ncbi:proton-conducting transporter membrane subunit [Xanthobacteraceae bacterium Astr-EGSB]|uniref:proton-conducting transporter transmembrane domain-containing protein n=1 Tax=Astrobacterium formosum TaxID=3069710 RepID=UPI0027B1D091|nr:proton-conducting transporter membrane subunit [Xanthobacteraceae bacterium Astr-EGSB]
MAPETLITLAILTPLVGALVIPLFHDRPNLRETVTLVTAGTLLLIVVNLLGPVLAGGRPEVTFVEVVPGLSLAFKVEPLGMLFSLVASSLWILNSIYSIGYMRGNKEPRQTSFYVCFAVALGSTIGLAFAKNLFTLFLCYEALTLSTYPLVTHKATDEAHRAGRLYLLLLLGTSLLLFLPAIIATWALAGTLDFTPGGILGGKASGLVIGVLLALYVFGIGKAAVMPMHFWLPAAMVAPTPVSALLHAVAVVKAGVFTVVKIVLYVFGLDVLSTTGANTWLIYLASGCILLASLIALSKDNLKARLAYSTVSQLAYVVLGAALATTMSLEGSAIQIATHAAGKITLFFCAGAIYVATHRTEVSQLDGLGRAMPFTFFAFLLGSLSIIGIPPFGGTWSKWMLALAAADSGHLVVVGVLMVSSLLNVGYLLSIVGRAFFLPPRDGVVTGIKEAPVACVVPLSLSALACVVLFFQIDAIQALVAGALTSPQ